MSCRLDEWGLSSEEYGLIVRMRDLLVSLEEPERRAILLVFGKLLDQMTQSPRRWHVRQPSEHDTPKAVPVS